MKSLPPLILLLFVTAPAQAQFWNFWRPACERRAIAEYWDCRAQVKQFFQELMDDTTHEELPEFRRKLKGQLKNCWDRRALDIKACRSHAPVPQTAQSQGDD